MDIANEAAPSMYLAHHINQKLSSKSVLKKMQQQYLNDPTSFFVLSKAELKHCVNSVTQFYRDLLQSTDLDGFVVGLSGGIDSALVAALAVKAVGSKQVYGIIMPSEYTPKTHVDDAQHLARELGIVTNNHTSFRKYFSAIITDLVPLLADKSADEGLQQTRTGNIHARLRMIILRDYAKYYNCLVAGTGNASESLLGYFTLGGDGIGGIDNVAIASFYKTQLYAIARYLELPESIMTRIPTAGLYVDQTDAKELGLPYKDIDLILVGYTLKLSESELADTLSTQHITPKDIHTIVTRCKTNAFKTKLPLQAVIQMRD